MNEGNLVLCPSVPVWRYQDKLLLDKKFHDGVIRYLECWSGTITLLMRQLDIFQLPPFGGVEVESQHPRLNLHAISGDEHIEGRHLVGACLALVSADNHMNLHVPKLCRSLSIPCICDIEYTQKTRIQMLLSEVGLTFASVKSIIWLLNNERRIRKALDAATSVQANGLPAYMKYGRKPDSIYYFDNRLTADLAISEEALDHRIDYLKRGLPLRLAFSGRLIRAKGADALLDLAAKLQARHVPFQLDIFGAGPLAGHIQEYAEKSDDSFKVVYHGAVDFELALVPHLKRSVDLFVCCHRQGDPSCSYLETYGCGVPIAGFSNEAHSSMVTGREIGWKVPINDVAGLASLVENLSTDRAGLAQYSRNSLEFARNNLFEKIFEMRMSHCSRIYHQSII